MSKQLRALVCGGTGFIGRHLADYLKDKGYFVRVVDINLQKYPTKADEIFILDLRDFFKCEEALEGGFDEVYQLAADMGGMGFIHSHEVDCLTNNVLINTNMATACSNLGVKRYFYSSSVCIYKDTKGIDKTLKEEDAYPACPDNEYGWEKLYSERVALAVGRNSEMKVRIARFENCYGPLGTWNGGREKAPAALCRKVAEAKDGGTIEVWGDGTATRSFIYVDDLVEGIYQLMHSEIGEPTNIGTEEIVTINGLVDVIAKVAGKRIKVRHVKGEVGVQDRNFSHKKIRSLGWKPRHDLTKGITKTYLWINEQVHGINI